MTNKNKTTRIYTKRSGNALYFVMLRDAERQILRDALAFCDGSGVRAAELLGVTANTVTNRARLLGGVYPDDPRKEADAKHSNGNSSTEDSALDSDQPTNDSNGIADRNDAEQDELARRDEQP